MKYSVEKIIEDGEKILKKKGILNSRFEASLIVQKTLDISKIEILTNNIRSVSFLKRILINKNFFERVRGKPISKIFGIKEFYSYEFFTNFNVLDPRPESEILVDVAKKILKKNKSTTHILELGVGSGCVIISIMQELREFRIKGTGVDISESSLKVAKKNQKKFKIVNLHLFRSNWFSNLTNKYDMIVSNPPYLKTSDIKFLDDEVKKYDPLVSLDGGKNGLNAYKEIASNVKKYLKLGGVICLEIGFGQRDSVNQICKEKGFELILEEKDLQDIPRVVVYKMK